MCNIGITFHRGQYCKSENFLAQVLDYRIARRLVPVRTLPPAVHIKRSADRQTLLFSNIDKARPTNGR